MRQYNLVNLKAKPLAGALIHISIIYKIFAEMLCRGLKLFLL